MGVVLHLEPPAVAPWWDLVLVVLSNLAAVGAVAALLWALCLVQGIADEARRWWSR